MTFASLLVANRGEIAVRVIRACRERDIRSIAVYSEADERSMHRRLADESYLIGPASATESYLNIERLVEAIEESGAEAVHPGYGFLSESAAFARAVEAAGAAWVGPPPDAMEAMGFKARAKELARRAGVPTVPGYDGEDQSEERLAEEAERIGYPLFVKASAGGGGRGMRVVSGSREFVESARAAKREAEAAFGDGAVFLEKLVEDPRHIEVQILADGHGNVVHLCERECSIQRRHQKVVEEAPSSALIPELRETICDAAVSLAREAGYRNAGTVEFLLAGGEFFFLEMNARLQVEHPVTELVTGMDLVHLQLAVAAGEGIPFSQEEVTSRGSAIEVRLYAEDDGLPAGGRLLAFSPPEGPGIRNDVGVEGGDEVSLFYDPMLAKLVVHASNRGSAVRRLRNALRDYAVLGVSTNLPLLRRIAGHPAFVAGETTTGFLEKHGLTEAPVETPPPSKAVLLAAVGEVFRLARPSSAEPFTAGPWRSLGAVRLRYRAGGEEHEVEVERGKGGCLILRLGEREAVVELLSTEAGRLRVVLDGQHFTADFAFEEGDVWISFRGESYRLSKPSPPSVDDSGSGGGGAESSLTAPMPGTVVEVHVREGDEVEEGQVILILEAMKMEQSVTAPHAGRVASLPYAEGALVPAGAVLAEIEGP
ncbi:MAG: biotin/lipoyl-binding protein [Actinomycetota bacterium]|nr:biotin/lipoyl-binding protein [Actinomycetota bacterium]